MSLVFGRLLQFKLQTSSKELEPAELISIINIMTIIAQHKILHVGYFQGILLQLFYGLDSRTVVITPLRAESDRWDTDKVYKQCYEGRNRQVYHLP
jgi:hypothetical protein